MKRKTIWLDQIQFSKPNILDKNICVDVLIIGGGITGLSIAYHLIDCGLKVCLVEGNLIAHGVSAHTTGKLTYLQENIYTKLGNKASLYYESQKEAISLVHDIIIKNNIDCNYQEVDSYIYTKEENQIYILKKEEEKLKELEINYHKCNNIPIDVNSKYAIKVNNTAYFHPIKYLIKLKEIITDKGIDVYENSKVTSIKKDNNKYVCEVNGYVIVANKVVIATHYPFFLFPYLLPLKTYLEKSYISASLTDINSSFSAITVFKPIESIRFHADNNKYLIYLNGSHNLCCKYNNQKNFDNLLSSVAKLNLKPAYLWSNHDIMTEDNLPYIGYLDDNLLIGTGYNTWGMTNGSLAGKIISDLILGNNNKYIGLFDPKRGKQLKNIVKYPLYISYSAKSFISNKIKKNKPWYSDQIIFKNIKGHNIAIYTDDNGKEHKVHNLCPHLKCSLIFNEVEKTWDCPCHGSRFDIDGKCLFGPSGYDIGY